MAIAIPPNVRTNDIGVLASSTISKQICNDIIELHKDKKNLTVQGKVQDSGSNVIDYSIRQVMAYIIHEDFNWVDRLIIESAIIANREYNFNLSGLLERPQLLQYKSPSNGYDWHLDIGNGDSSTRKISVSIPLNDDYEGGDIAFFSQGQVSVKPDIGQVVTFPSFLPHKIMPVTKGTRWSLVCWVSGEPFR